MEFYRTVKKLNNNQNRQQEFAVRGLAILSKVLIVLVPFVLHQSQPALCQQVKQLSKLAEAQPSSLADLINREQNPISLENEVNSVAFSPDGKWIVSGSSDKTVRLWDVSTGKPIGNPLTGHEDEVNSVAFSPDGKWIVSGSSDKTMRLRSASTNAQ